MRRFHVSAVTALVILAAGAIAAPSAFGDIPGVPGVPSIPTAFPTSMPTAIPTDVPDMPDVPGVDTSGTSSAFVLPPCPPSLADLPSGVGTVTGSVQTPSGAYALAGASVSVVNGSGVEVGKTMTDGCGRFRVDGIAPGKYKLAYGVRTFKGSTALDVGATGAKITVKADASFLKIAVFQGEWDHVEKILDKIGVSYTKFPARTVAKQDLSKFNVVFINCGETNDDDVTPADQKKLQNFVDGGGALYVSDRAIPYITQSFPTRSTRKGTSARRACAKATSSTSIWAGFCADPWPSR